MTSRMKVSSVLVALITLAILARMTGSVAVPAGVIAVTNANGTRCDGTCDGVQQGPKETLDEYGDLFQVNKTGRLFEDIGNMWSRALTEIQKENTAVAEGRGKKGKKKGYGKIMMMFAGLMKATFLYIMLHAVAAVAGKALVVAKIALAIAVAVALKKSSDNKVAYEIVKHPQYSSVSTHSSSVDYDHHGAASGGNYEGGTRRRRRITRR